MELNVSRGRSYFTQRNNRRFPLSSCNPTAMIQALVASGISLPEIPKGVQAEDFLTGITEGPEALSERAKLPTSFHSIPPRQIHSVLSFCTNRMMGREVTKFSTNITIQRILWELVQGRACTVSTNLTSYGHIVAVVGFRSKQELKSMTAMGKIDLGLVEGLIVDDPFGNYYWGYKVHNGNDVFFPFADFNKYVRASNDTQRKWAHLILPGA